MLGAAVLLLLCSRHGHKLRLIHPHRAQRRGDKHNMLLRICRPGPGARLEKGGAPR